MHDLMQYRFILVGSFATNPSFIERQLNELGLDGWYVSATLPDYILMERPIESTKEEEEEEEDV